jgi:quaternary ammonium compound-resistance protein SugE
MVRCAIDGSVHRRIESLAWFFLLLAGLLEIVWATAMKLSDGFSRPGASVVTLVASMGSFVLLALAMRSLPLGTAYTVWTGIGAIGAFVVGVVYLGESVTLMRVMAALLILTGIMLMKGTSTG